MTPSSTMDYKAIILSELDTMRKKEIQEKQPFKARAYTKVIQELKDFPHPITQIGDVEGIPGIGVKIRAKIEEILQSGELQAAKVAREEGKFRVLDELLEIHGIGPVKARELVSKHKVTSIDDLRQKWIKDPTILNQVQTLGLNYYEEIKERIPRTEMAEHEKILLHTIREVQPDFEAIVVGSYRRELSNSGDIDMILKLPKSYTAKASGENFQRVIDRLEEIKYIVDILAKGNKKCMAIVRLPDGKARRLDLLLTPEEEYAYALLYFTGSGSFNVAMRQYALEKGYSMNEHRIKIMPDMDPPPKPVPMLTTEKEIFAFLQIPYILPKNRTPEELERVLRARKA